jgi:hypothetical protein
VDGAVQGQVLGLERSHPDTPPAKYAAKPGGQEAFAPVRAGTQDQQGSVKHRFILAATAL